MIEKKRIENKSSRTAAYTCTCRAASFLEKNPYYKSDDYIAVKLLPRFVKLLIKLKILNLKSRISPKGIYPYVIARTIYFDSIFNHAIRNGFDQILIFGAGFDSRAIRLLKSTDNIKVFETDAYHTIDAKYKQFKKRKIIKSKNNIYIPIDFEKEDIRTKINNSEFKKNKKTLFILEGLTMYLSPNAIDDTFKLIDEYSAPNSTIVFDYIFASVLRREHKFYGESAIYGRVKKDNEKWTFGIEEGEIENFLENFNLNLIEHLDSITIENKYFKSNTGKIITKVNGTHCIVLAEKIK